MRIAAGNPAGFSDAQWKSKNPWGRP